MKHGSFIRLFFFVDEDSLSIVDQIVCDHAKFQGQNKVTARFCHREGQGQTQNGGEILLVSVVMFCIMYTTLPFITLTNYGHI